MRSFVPPVRDPGLEPGTSSLSVTRSNHLSYTRTDEIIDFQVLMASERTLYISSADISRAL